MWVLLPFIHLATLCPLIEPFTPFAFKVILDMYVLIAILLTVFEVLLCFSLLLLFSL